MTETQAYTYIMQRAVEMAESGFRLSIVGDAYILTKKYEWPRENRTLTMRITNTVSSQWSHRPRHCELCGCDEPYIDMFYRDGGVIVACKKCHDIEDAWQTDNYERNGCQGIRGWVGIYEWGWCDSVGEIGVSGSVGKDKV